MRLNGKRDVFLIPGFMTDETLWEDMVVDLLRIGPLHHCDVRQDDTIEAIAQRAVVACPERFILIGFSMGGYIAREIVRLVPERVGALVLIATSARADTAQETQRKRETLQAIPPGPFRGMSRSAIAASLRTEIAIDPCVIARIKEMGIRLGRDVYIRQLTLPRGGDLDRLAAMRCPTLVIGAAQDRVRTLAESKELQEGIPGARLEIIQNAGHMVPIEQPVLLSDAIVSWLGAAPEFL